MINIIEKTRNLINDNLLTTGYYADEFISSRIFTLSDTNISSATILVYKNGVLWADSNYSYDDDTNKLTITGTLVAGDTIEVTYSYYEKYSDNELRGYIRSALYYLSNEKYKVFVAKSDNVLFPTATEDEENVIAKIASILISPSIKGYKTSEIEIKFTENLSKDDKIKQVIRQFSKTPSVLRYVQLDKDLTEDL